MAMWLETSAVYSGNRGAANVCQVSRPNTVRIFLGGRTHTRAVEVAYNVKASHHVPEISLKRRHRRHSEEFHVYK